MDKTNVNKAVGCKAKVSHCLRLVHELHPGISKEKFDIGWSFAKHGHDVGLNDPAQCLDCVVVNQFEYEWLGTNSQDFDVNVGLLVPRFVGHEWMDHLLLLEWNPFACNRDKRVANAFPRYRSKCNNISVVSLFATILLIKG